MIKCYFVVCILPVVVAITERYLPLEDALKDVMEKELEVIIMEEKLVTTNTLSQ